jgi:hypothetical protein
VGDASLLEPSLAFAALLVDESLVDQKVVDQPARRPSLAPGCLSTSAKKADEAAAPPKNVNGFGAQFPSQALLKRYRPYIFG